MAWIKWRTTCSKIVEKYLFRLRLMRSTAMLRKAPEEKNSSKRTSSNRYVRVIGTGASETSPSLYLFTDGGRYLFNCGGSTERFCLEHKVRVSKLENVFITRPSWDCWGGLSGLAMGMRTNEEGAGGKVEMNLYGPQGIRHFKEAIELVVHGERIIFNPIVLEEDCATLYRDDEITVTGVRLQAEQSKGSVQSPTEGESGCKEPDFKRKKLVHIQTSIVYLCQLADIPGKFDNKKAKALGLKPGPLYAKLVQGESVSGPNDSIIRPSDVLGPPHPGPVFVVVDCPNQQILSELLRNKSIFGALDLQSRSVLVVHMTPREIVHSEEYVQWAQKFGESTRHIFLHSSVCDQEYVFRRSLKIQAPLHAVSSNVFLLPENERLHPEPALPPPLQSVSKRGSVMLVHHFYPSKKEGWDDSDCLSPVSDVADQFLEEFKSNLESNRKSSLLKEVSEIASPKKSGVSVTFLGTGSAIPSKYRNVTSILMKMPTGFYILLDCGEGTLQQLYRCHGNNTHEILKKLSCVFVSHMHGDHNLDLINIIKCRQELNTKPNTDCGELLVMGPRKLGEMLALYSNTCEQLSYSFAINYHHRFDSIVSPLPSVRRAAVELGLQNIHTVIVEHCWDAYGIVLRGRDSGGKIVFSGDTRPCQDLIEVGRGAKLLIHEATFDDELKKEALERKHCTVSDALTVSKDMQAQYTIFTHFSQRSYCPQVPDKMFDASSKISLAFDCMRINLDQIEEFYKLQRTVQNTLGQIVDNEQT